MSHSHRRLIALAALASSALLLGATAPKAKPSVLPAPAPATAGIYAFEVKRINGAKEAEPVKLTDYKGKVALFVNVASECGYTKQYKGLQAIYDKYGKDGFVILGFPSNDFGGQEPGSSAEIKNFCERNFKVSFPLFEKGPVKGAEIQPVYGYLTANAPTKGDVSWNFEKFLVGRDGKIVGRFKSGVTPESKELTDAVEAQLKAKP